MDALHVRLINVWIKSLTATTQECCKHYWTGPRGNTQQSSSCTATYYPSRKLSKLDEPDMRDIAGEVGTSSLVMYSYGLLHMAEQKQGDQLEPTYSSSVRIRGVALRTWRKRWTFGRGSDGGSGISVLMARPDDNDIGMLSKRIIGIRLCGNQIAAYHSIQTIISRKRKYVPCWILKFQKWNRKTAKIWKKLSELKKKTRKRKIWT